MSDHEDNTYDTGYSTPVPELDDHRHLSPLVQRPLSRRGTVDTMYGAAGRVVFDPDLNLVNDGLLHPEARDFEEAIVDEESAARSPFNGRTAPPRSRRGTVETLDPRSVSPPNSVKAFADARRREREIPIIEENDPSKPFAITRRPSECNPQIYRTKSGASGNSRRSRRFGTDDDGMSFAASCKSAEEDVCFPLRPTPDKGSLQIDFEVLEDFIAEEEILARATPIEQPQARVFHDLRSQKSELIPTFTSDGDFISAGSLSTNEKLPEDPAESNYQGFSGVQPQLDGNRFEFFSSLGESTIHAAELGDLVLPGEDIRTLFTFPQGEELDGVWWLNMNNPTEAEVHVICKAFGVHPLTIEDIKTQEAREKIELFPSYYFACFRSFHVVEVEGGQEYKPFNLYVVVFREGTLSFSFSSNRHAPQVRKRITYLKDYVDLSSDWICYALIDDIVDSFAPVINAIELESDLIEDQVFTARTDDLNPFLRRIGVVRKNVMGLMKLLGGKADVLKGFTKRCNANYKVTPRMDIGLYLGDIQDHVVTMMTNLGHFEKMLSRSHSNYLAQLSIENIVSGNHANKVLSKITVLASVLVPLNLICGMFGMNVLVPWRDVNNLGPFFGIFGFLVLFVVVSLSIARKWRYI